MELYQIYTSGATKHVDKEQSLNWRMEAKNFLENNETKYKIDVFVPETYFNYETLPPINNRQCQTHFIHRVKTSKLMLVNLDNSDRSVGTGMEVQCAVDHDIPVIGFGTENIYPWISDDCHIVFDDLYKALVYIRDYYLK